MNKRPGNSHWEGHERATSTTLLDVLTTAATGSARVSHSDRVLFTACEFWAAARNYTLVDQFSEDAVDQLRSAEAAFTIIGLTKTADTVRRVRVSMTESVPPAALKSVADALEKALAQIDEPVDHRIAEYANEQALERQNRTD